MARFHPTTFRQALVESLARATPKSLSFQGYQRAGVLVPIVSIGGVYQFLFTKRTETVETHKGQVSFPGGVVDRRDRDIVETALREAWEEIGIRKEEVETIGVLDDLQTPTGFIITPIVGLITNPPTLSVNSLEVAEVFHIPVAFFADPANGRKEMRVIGGTQREVWYYETETHTIWGATAIIIRSLLATLQMG